MEGCLPLNIVFHGRSSSIKGNPPLKVIFHIRSSSIEGCLHSKVSFHWWSASIKGRLPQKVSSIEGCLPSKLIKQIKLVRLDKGKKKHTNERTKVRLRYLAALDNFSLIDFLYKHYLVLINVIARWPPEQGCSCSCQNCWWRRGGRGCMEWRKGGRRRFSLHVNIFSCGAAALYPIIWLAQSLAVP